MTTTPVSVYANKDGSKVLAVFGKMPHKVYENQTVEHYEAAVCTNGAWEGLASYTAGQIRRWFPNYVTEAQINWPPVQG